MYRVELWELGPYGWRGCSDADYYAVDLDSAQTHALHQLRVAALDGVTAWVTISDRDGLRLFEGRSKPKQLSTN